MIPSSDSEKLYLLELKLDQLKSEYTNGYITEKGFQARKKDLIYEFPEFIHVFDTILSNLNSNINALPSSESFATSTHPGSLRINSSDNINPVFQTDIHSLSSVEKIYDLYSSPANGSDSLASKTTQHNPPPSSPNFRSTASFLTQDPKSLSSDNTPQNSQKIFTIGDSQLNTSSNPSKNPSISRASTIIRKRENLIKSLSNNRDTFYPEDDSFLNNFYQQDGTEVRLLHELINPTQNSFSNFHLDFSRRNSIDSDPDDIIEVISLKQLSRVADNEVSFSRANRPFLSTSNHDNCPFIYDPIIDSDAKKSNISISEIPSPNNPHDNEPVIPIDSPSHTTHRNKSIDLSKNLKNLKIDNPSNPPSLLQNNFDSTNSNLNLSPLHNDEFNLPNLPSDIFIPNFSPSSINLSHSSDSISSEYNLHPSPPNVSSPLAIDISSALSRPINSQSNTHNDLFNISSYKSFNDVASNSSQEIITVKDLLKTANDFNNTSSSNSEPVYVNSNNLFNSKNKQVGKESSDSISSSPNSTTSSTSKKIDENIQDFISLDDLNTSTSSAIPGPVPSQRTSPSTSIYDKSLSPTNPSSISPIESQTHNRLDNFHSSSPNSTNLDLSNNNPLSTQNPYYSQLFDNSGENKLNNLPINTESTPKINDVHLNINTEPMLEDNLKNLESTNQSGKPSYQGQLASPYFDNRNTKSPANSIINNPVFDDHHSKPEFDARYSMSKLENDYNHPHLKNKHNNAQFEDKYNNAQIENQYNDSRFENQYKDLQFESQRNSSQFGSQYNNKRFAGQFDNTQIKDDNIPFPKIQNGDDKHPSLVSSTSFSYPREIIPTEDSSELTTVKQLGDIVSILKHRSSKFPESIAYTCINNHGNEISSISWSQLYKKSMLIYEVLLSQNIRFKGERVALVYRKYEFVNYIASLYACFFGGFVAVPLVSSDSIEDLVFILKTTNCKTILSSQLNIDALRRDVLQNSKNLNSETDNELNEMQWLNTDLILGEPVSEKTQTVQLSTSDLAYIEYTKSPTGELKGVMMSHGTLISQCIGWVMNLGMLGFSKKNKLQLESDKISVRKNSSATNSGAKSGSNDLPPSSPANFKCNRDPSLSPTYDVRRNSIISTITNGSYGRKNTVVPALSVNTAKSKTISLIPALKPKSKKKSSLGFFNKILSSTVNSSSRKSLKPSTSPHNKIIGLNSPVDTYLDTMINMNQPSILSAPSIYSAEASFEQTLANAPDTILIQVDPRQTLGLTLGIFTSTFSGSHSIYISKLALDDPCLYLQLLSKYRISIVLGEYSNLQKVLTTASDDPEAINNYNRLPNPNLSFLRLILINTLYIDTDFHRIFNNVVLRRYGCPVIQILENENRPVLTPVISLPEHSGLLLSLENRLDGSNELSSNLPMTSINSSSSYNFNGISEVYLNHNDLLHEKITVLSESEINLHSPESNSIKIPLFGLPSYYSTVAIVNPESRFLCDNNTVGEIWVDSLSICEGFWAMAELSELTYAAQFFFKSNNGIESHFQQFLRTGLMGALINGRLMVLGYYEDRLKITTDTSLDLSQRNTSPLIHYSGKLFSTLSESYSSSIDGIAFEVLVNDFPLIVLLIELSDTSLLSPSVTQDISNLLSKKCKLIPYAIGICSPNYLPRSYKYGVYSLCASSCKKLWDSGQVNCLFIKFSPGNSILGLPHPFKSLEIGSQPPGIFLTYNEQGIPIKKLQKTIFTDEVSPMIYSNRVDLFNYTSITQIIIDRANQTPNSPAFTEIDAFGSIKNTVSFYKLLSRVSSLAKYYRSKLCIQPGDFVMISILTGIEFVSAIHACLAIGAVPVILTPVSDPRLNSDLAAMMSVVLHFKIKVILVDSPTESIINSSTPTLSTLSRFKTNVFNQTVKAHKMDNISILGKSNFMPFIQKGKELPTLVMLYNGTQANSHTYAIYNHSNIINFCTQQINSFNLSFESPLIASARSYNGFGLLHISFLGLFTGSQTLILSPDNFLTNPLTWIGIISKYKIKTPFSTIPMLEHAFNALQRLDPLKLKSDEMYLSIQSRLGPNISLDHVTNLLVSFDERPDIDLFNRLSVFLSRYHLNPNSISIIYGSQMNSAISFKSYGDNESLSLQLDVSMVRKGVVVPILQRQQTSQSQQLIQTPFLAQPNGSFPSSNNVFTGNFPESFHNPSNSIFVQDSGKVSKSSIVAIVDPESKTILEAGKLGEVWVYSKSNSSCISNTSVNKKLINQQTSLTIDPTRNSFSSELKNDSLSPVSIDRLKSSDDPIAMNNNFVRTGDYGFLIFENPNNVNESPYLFILGKSANVIKLDGYTHFRSDIETTIKSIISVYYNVQEECILIDTMLPKYPSSKSSISDSQIQNFRNSASIPRSNNMNNNVLRKQAIHSNKPQYPTHADSESFTLKSFSKTTNGNNNYTPSLYSNIPGHQQISADTPPSNRFVAVIAINTNAINQGLLGNLASLIFQSILIEHKFLLNEVLFVYRGSLTRSRILEKRLSITTSQYESGSLSNILSFPFNR
ncbi:hypothetical protein AYI69_g4059 [Smittium culicis]|uniref:DMAP1-binding domain-containing protein n=1 Tax=Smittium culicis TaxID=133412 RepID=A0A1R1YH00_9FUNG|nr:hypothetical protein AYI69_g4059 [Smittium culicis]